MNPVCAMCRRNDYLVQAYGELTVCAACAIPFAANPVAQVQAREKFIADMLRSVLGGAL